MVHPRESSVTTVSRETLATYRETFHTDAASYPSEMAIAEMCGRLAYCVEQLLELVEDKSEGIGKAVGVAYEQGRRDEREIDQ